MNTKTPAPFDPREWADQERGMQAARDGASGLADPDAEHYRLVAAAVARVPRSAPPADFAATVAARAAQQDAGPERALSHGLLLALGAASVTVALLYAGPALQAIEVELAGAMPWIATGTCCIALSWMLGRAAQLRAIAATVARA